MVSAKISQPTGKSLHNHVLLPLQHPKILPLDDVDLDFSDIFAPAPAQVLSSENVAMSETNGFIYEEAAVIYSRCHSFVGPTNYVSQSLKLSKFTLGENEHLLELVEGDSGEIKDHLEEATCDTAVTEKSDIHANVTTPRSVGLDDFEVLKVVGQGAFGKVYQVRKIGTSEILAMKVMRKDKILEKDHAEYMNTERDVLTKIDHPFIVRPNTDYTLCLTLLMGDTFSFNSIGKAYSGRIWHASTLLRLFLLFCTSILMA